MPPRQVFQRRDSEMVSAIITREFYAGKTTKAEELALAEEDG
jgi:hypothetical protein